MKYRGLYQTSQCLQEQEQEWGLEQRRRAWTMRARCCLSSVTPSNTCWSPTPPWVTSTTAATPGGDLHHPEWPQQQQQHQRRRDSAGGCGHNYSRENVHQVGSMFTRVVFGLTEHRSKSSPPCPSTSSEASWTRHGVQCLQAGNAVWQKANDVPSQSMQYSWCAVQVHQI